MSSTIRLWVTSAALLTLAQIATAQMHGPRVGVMDLEPATGDSMFTEEASIALTAALVRTRNLEVLDQSALVQEYLTGTVRRQVEREELLQTIGVESCSETQCLAELGAEVGARFMIAGTVSRRANATTIGVRMVDVFERRILAYPTKNYGGDALGALDRAMSAIAADIVGAIPGILHLTGVPADATILVDGEERTWQADRALNITPGRHHIQALRDGFFDVSSRVDVEYGEPVYEDLAMRPKSQLSAGTRSLIVPGLGHYYSGRPVRGTAYLMLEVAALAGAVYGFRQFTDASDLYESAKTDYEGMAKLEYTQPEIDGARELMYTRYDESRSARSLAISLLAGLAAVHIVSSLDAVLGFPDIRNVRIVQRDRVAALRIDVVLPFRPL